MILLALAFASNFVFTWVIPIACVCACACAYVASENQALRMNENRGFFDSGIRASNTRKKPRK